MPHPVGGMAGKKQVDTHSVVATRAPLLSWAACAVGSAAVSCEVVRAGVERVDLVLKLQELLAPKVFEYLLGSWSLRKLIRSGRALCWYYTAVCSIFSIVSCVPRGAVPA